MIRSLSATIPSSLTVPVHNNFSNIWYSYSVHLSNIDPDWKKDITKSIRRRNISDGTIVGGISSDVVSQFSLRTLDIEGWLSGEIIDFFAASFTKFYTNCMCFRYTLYSQMVNDGLYGFDKVYKWTRKLNIFSKWNRIVVPINWSGVHWAIIAVGLEHKTITYYDDLTEAKLKMPCKTALVGYKMLPNNIPFPSLNQNGSKLAQQTTRHRQITAVAAYTQLQGCS